MSTAYETATMEREGIGIYEASECSQEQVRKRPRPIPDSWEEDLPEQVDYIFDESFHDPHTEEDLFGQAGRRMEVAVWSRSKALDAIPANRQANMTREEERQLFLRMNYARFRLAQLMKQWQPEDRSEGVAREMVLWHRRANRARAQILRGNLGLVHSMARRTHVAGIDICELISEGHIVLLRTVDRFDVSRGTRFSTYACRSILKGLGRLVQRIRRRNGRLSMHLTPNLQFYESVQSDYDMEKNEELEDLRVILKENRANLSDTEQTIVKERFALGGDGKPKTLAEVAKIVGGVTDERVRQLQLTALAKIRAAFE